MKTLVSILTALLLIGAGPVLAGERDGRGGGGYGGGCGAGCGHPGGGYNTNVNVNLNAHAYGSAAAYAGAGASINARAYDVGSVGPRGPVYGGVVSTGGDYGYSALGGYGYGGGYGPVIVTGPGYGPSRPHGYVVSGFGRRSVTTDRCGGDCEYPPARPPSCDNRCGPTSPPPPSCSGSCRNGGHGVSHGGDYGQLYSGSVSGSSYSVRERYSESASDSGGYRGEYATDDRAFEQGHGGPRYAPVPYHAAPLEPVTYDHGAAPQKPHYAPPPVGDSEPTPLPAPADHQGDLPPGDTGEGMPYRQEPGERG